MFKESRDIPAERGIEHLQISQTEIDDFVDAEIERVYGSGAEDEQQYNAFMTKLIAKQFNVEPSEVVQAKTGWKIIFHGPSGERNVLIDIEQDVNNSKGEVSIFMTADDRNSPSHLTVKASPDRLRSIRERMRKREEKIKAEELERKNRYTELLPTLLVFARDHALVRLKQEECGSINEFIDLFAGGALKKDEEIEIAPFDHEGTQGAKIWRYRNGEVIDILEYSA